MFLNPQEVGPSAVDWLWTPPGVAIVVAAVTTAILSLWWYLNGNGFAASYNKHDIHGQLVDLRKGCLMNGPTHIYPLWKSILECWFSDRHTRVYLVTPFMDEERMVDVCQIILQHRQTANVGAIYVRELCGVRIPQNAQKVSVYQTEDKTRKTQNTAALDPIMDGVLNKLKSKDRNYTQKNVFSKLINPKMRFHAKFMAGVRGGKADVLMTSANFQASHFEYQNYENMSYVTMSEGQFMDRFITPLLVKLPDAS